MERKQIDQQRTESNHSSEPVDYSRDRYQALRNNNRPMSYPTRSQENIQINETYTRYPVHNPMDIRQNNDDPDRRYRPEPPKSPFSEDQSRDEGHRDGSPKLNPNKKNHKHGYAVNCFFRDPDLQQNVPHHGVPDYVM